MKQPYVCTQCMNPTDQPICPKCGGTAENGRRIRDALPPMTILNGKYLLGAAMGGGGFGITYRALKLNSLEPMQGDMVAVKEYFPHQLATRVQEDGGVVPSLNNQDVFKRWRSKFVQEYQMLRKMDHCPSVVQVLDIFEENNTAYLVMEYIEGITIERRVRSSGPIPADELLPLLEPFINDLCQLNERQVLHRDINPANIILRKDGKPLLIDFGSVRPNDPATRKTVVVRKGYAPPEQYQAGGEQGAWTDVYGLCATMYFALTGVEPPDSMERKYDDKLQDIGQLCRALTRRQADVLMAGLSMDHTKRPASFATMAAELYYVRPNQAADDATGRAGKAAELRQKIDRSKSPTLLNQDADDVTGRLLAARKAATLLQKIDRSKGATLLKELDNVSRLNSFERQTAELEQLLARGGLLFRLLSGLRVRKQTGKTPWKQ